MAVASWRISADTGGTFTDFIADGPDGDIRKGKVLSSGRIRTIIHGVDDSILKIDRLPFGEADWLVGRSILINGSPCGKVVEFSGDRLVVDQPVKCENGDFIEIDTGLEAPVLAMRMFLPELDPDDLLSFRLGTTKGTNTLLENKGARVALFLTEGFQDLLLIRDQKRPDLFARSIEKPLPLYHRVYPVQERLDTEGRELLPLDEDKLAKVAAIAIKEGCEVAAVCLLNAWKNPGHEKSARDILAESGFADVCISSSIRSLIKYLDRTDTTLVNAALIPVMDAYLDRVEAGINGHGLWVMTSAGGLVSRKRFHAVDSLISGPAGGVLGAVAAGRRAGLEKIIGLDMGGTSTDVSRWKTQLELRQHIQVGAARILAPAMPIETVAAGGGSVCGYADGRLFVGPESAGADPGPASYGAGGPLCITDIHLLLGRIEPSAFSIPIRLEDAKKRLEEIMEIAGESDWQALAEGFLTIATERMAHAIRQVTVREGEDPSSYGLVAFGGAGGLHACRIAEELGIETIIYPSDAGILSAAGIHSAPRETVCEKQLFSGIEQAADELEKEFKNLQDQATGNLIRDGLSDKQLSCPVRTVFIRIQGQESGLPVQWETGQDLKELFRERFVAIFGYYPESPQLEIIKIRLRMEEEVPDLPGESFDKEEVEGPHILSNSFGTFYVEKGWVARKGDFGSIQMTRGKRSNAKGGKVLEKVRRTLVMNRLEGLVEEMGEQLRRTALSTNIRERLDFSCGLLDAEGRLLVNAPHIPVHLGALGLCLRRTLQEIEITPGDVVVTNHPAFGGSHLPDVTLIRGLFDSDGSLMGYLANRAHHAEFGGKSPGSMPADARSLAEEGVIIAPMHLIRKNGNLFKDVEAILKDGKYPSRLVRENLIDLEAQLASLEKGRQLFASLLDDYGQEKISRYFAEIYNESADALLGALEEKGEIRGTAMECLDDGHQIKVEVTISGQSMEIDFNGTGPVHPGNLNATPAIVQSAVLYVLRLFVDAPLPLNEGLLKHVEVKLPQCFLNPPFDKDPTRCPAVVGGNVETSQRVVDALIRALGIMASGQGTMNNLLFGNRSFGYYETIGGGAGAGNGYHGASAVHVHMTNTAITDAEILEQRFPVMCREFSIRRDSGGNGLYRGGDGLVRELVFREPVTISLLTQNRKRGAVGMDGGMDGLPGRQFKVGQDGGRTPLEGITSVDFADGEAIRIETPGGGGWGSPEK